MIDAGQLGRPPRLVVVGCGRAVVDPIAARREVIGDIDRDCAHAGSVGVVGRLLVDAAQKVAAPVPS